jgi:hypothetical protein
MRRSAQPRVAIISPIPSLIPVSQGQLKNLIGAVGGRLGKVGIEPKFDGLLEVGAKLTESFSLSNTARQGGDLCPKPAFLRLMNNGLNCHGRNVLSGNSAVKLYHVYFAEEIARDPSTSSRTAGLRSE